MSEQMIIFSEPELEFRYGQSLVDPRHGLTVFGPYDADSSTKPRLNYILLGTSEGIDKFSSWSSSMNQPFTNSPGDNYRLWPPFPGFESAFLQEWPSQPIWSFQLNRERLITVSKKKDEHERSFAVVEEYLEGLRRAHKMDMNIGVAICIVPETVWQNCRPKSTIKNPSDKGIPKKQKAARKAGQIDMFADFDPDQYWHSPDFRRQLKARSMKYGIPIQIIRETTLRLNDDSSWGTRQLTPLSDRMWNLSTAMYYKCGGKPWRLISARDGVCYIGIAFRRADEGKTACCAAQMFLNTGDGIVFLGEYGPWYSPEDNQFHLDKDAATRLLKGILDTYQDLEGKKLTEVFLHSRSTLSQEEYQGFREACPDNVKLTGIKVRREGIDSLKLFRYGDMPIIRGSFLRINQRSGLLWGTGYKPQIETYDGWDIPAPLRIDIEYGDAPLERVAQDILGLTKLNYNACKLGDSEPVTVGYSDAVGEILISNPRVEERSPHFKFYI